MLGAMRARVLPLIEQQRPIRGWMVDDTGIPKKGTHSAGVARQYYGQLGKQDNCQVTVMLSVAADRPRWFDAMMRTRQSAPDRWPSTCRSSPGDA
jgi:SRSO17 transposase